MLKIGTERPQPSYNHQSERDRERERERERERKREIDRDIANLKDLEDGPYPPHEERKIVLVDLKNHPTHGIGLEIVGGDFSGRLDLGLFIKR